MSTEKKEKKQQQYSWMKRSIVDMCIYMTMIIVLGNIQRVRSQANLKQQRQRNLSIHPEEIFLN